MRTEARLLLAVTVAACASIRSEGSQVVVEPAYRGRELPAGELLLSPVGEIAFDVAADHGLDARYYDALLRRLPQELRNATRFDEVRWADPGGEPRIERHLPLPGGALQLALPADGSAAFPNGTQRWVLFLSAVKVTLSPQAPRRAEQVVEWALWDEQERHTAAYGRARTLGTLDWSGPVFQVGEREAEVEVLVTDLAVALAHQTPFFPGQRL